MQLQDCYPGIHPEAWLDMPIPLFNVHVRKMPMVLAQRSLRSVTEYAIASGNINEYDNKGRIKKNNAKPILDRWQREARDEQPHQEGRVPTTLGEFTAYWLAQGARLDEVPSFEERDLGHEEGVRRMLKSRRLASIFGFTSPPPEGGDAVSILG